MIGPVLRQWALIHCRRLFNFFAYSTRPCCERWDRAAAFCPRAELSARAREGTRARFFMRTCERTRAPVHYAQSGGHTFYTRGGKRRGACVGACERACVRVCTHTRTSALARISRCHNFTSFLYLHHTCYGEHSRSCRLYMPPASRPGDHVSMLSMLSMVLTASNGRAHAHTRAHHRLFNLLQIIARDCKNRRSTEHCTREL